MGQKSRSEKWKEENAFFINLKTGKLQYNKKCQKCICNCKQSYRTSIVACPYFTAKPKGDKQNA